MATTCSTCGYRLDAGQKFCVECGTPVGTVPHPLSPDHMEYCEITWKAKTWFASRRAYFWAKNLETREEVLRSSKLFEYYKKPLTGETFPSPLYHAQAALEEAIQRLLDAGWVPMEPPGVEWWSKRFCRPVKL